MRQRLMVWTIGTALWSIIAVAPKGVFAQSDRPLPVERVKIDTTDGVRLKADYYPVRTGRDSPVVVMLADEGESRTIFRSLAKRIQSPEEGKPMAVLAVDLRGQGDSTEQRLAGGRTADLSGKKLGARDLGAMVHRDLESVRSFLVEENDKGKLNLNRLAIVGVGMGAVIATNGAALDWSVPMLNTGKQGQDTKALVLISPPWKYKAVGVLEALRQPGVQSEVAILLLYGKEDKKSVSSAEKIVRQLERARGEFPDPDPSAEELPSVLDIAGRSSLKGTAWLKQAGPKAEALIVRYLQQYLVEPEYPWVARRLD